MASKASKAAQSGIISPARLHHVVLKTHRLDEMTAWYSTVLGTEEVAKIIFSEKGPVASFTSYDEANHRLAFFGGENFEGQATPESVGLHHIAFEYNSIDDLIHNYKRLRDKGVAPVWVTDHGPTISFYYSDPDSNLVEQQIDNFPDEPGASKRFMETDEKFNDPAQAKGEDVDPEQLVEARESGLSAAEIHAKAWVGELAPDEPVGPPGLPPIKPS
jgi:catechol 2,3-dioxygenase